MSDTLGAAPYTASPSLSLWERFTTWWRERGTMSAEELQARIKADFDALAPSERDALIDAHLPPSLRRSRACGETSQ